MPRSQLIKCALWLVFAVGGRLLWERRQQASEELWLCFCRAQGFPALVSAVPCSVSCSSLEIVMVMTFSHLKLKKSSVWFVTVSRTQILTVKELVLP